MSERKRAWPFRESDDTTEDTFRQVNLKVIGLGCTLGFLRVAFKRS
jgi:hypothetical protein